MLARYLLVCSTHNPASAENAGVPGALVVEGLIGDDTGPRQPIAMTMHRRRPMGRFISSWYRQEGCPASAVEFPSEFRSLFAGVLAQQ
jgi:hypothetical protein